MEKTVQSGEIPEQKIDMTKTDDSVDNLVEGFVRDVTYVLTIPAVVKQEKGENDDDDNQLVIVRVTPATMGPSTYQGSEEGGPFTTAISEQECRSEGSL